MKTFAIGSALAALAGAASSAIGPLQDLGRELSRLSSDTSPVRGKFTLIRKYRFTSSADNSYDANVNCARIALSSEGDMTRQRRRYVERLEDKAGVARGTFYEPA